ncbi:hypothetical protein CO230_00330 [Chryseobacterium sp. 6424]|uniref:hypothetical protein n=1 Tax=Chryseobacterium sp. 6424 TaxID=2039166 RepID=UPI000EFB45E0|nr:hypothetical protein [Chryseobacterium sp. 6424]AYO56716.1 hypothetical protein CO230_00330 [Chryseobacterium sp. 6424]
MKGILKIYHPEETLKYHLGSTYCKAVYSNKQHFLEVDVITDDSVDHVEDDSLQYNFPQLRLTISDFLIDGDEIAGKSFQINDSDDEIYTEVDLYDDEEAYLFNNELSYDLTAEGDLQLCWKGEISDFYTGADEPIPFKLKCHFKPDIIQVEDED